MSIAILPLGGMIATLPPNASGSSSSSQRTYADPISIGMMVDALPLRDPNLLSASILADVSLRPLSDIGTGLLAPVVVPEVWVIIASSRISSDRSIGYASYSLRSSSMNSTPSIFLSSLYLRRRALSSHGQVNSPITGAWMTITLRMPRSSFSLARVRRNPASRSASFSMTSVMFSFSFSPFSLMMLLSPNSSASETDAPVMLRPKSAKMTSAAGVLLKCTLVPFFPVMPRAENTSA